MIVCPLQEKVMNFQRFLFVLLTLLFATTVSAFQTIANGMNVQGAVNPGGCLCEQEGHVDIIVDDYKPSHKSVIGTNATLRLPEGRCTQISGTATKPGIAAK